ncbi:Alkylated DNA repair dioxygenase AlkB [Algoriphagus ornithinivorans]|uniref:Alkylated DNA repair dioxygenase AlkB n=1 Tax=Algoriphagus ornithinivorans TaxID=226506 RepID=A0A1I5ANB2_9BACT|nr:alpha-ketoglutarate-dependent dioxygenase AlkB [Algoriphagus ornithinivorans]SFN63689.1 Alkylated DNA repair dioxygenase AlkB [Algoriphagus ornithinivorans]
MQEDLFQKSGQNLLPFQGEVRYYPDFIRWEKASELYRRLEKEIEWKQEPIRLFGKTILQPRLTALYGDPEKSYSYSGITMNPIPWNNTLREIKFQIEKLSMESFTHVLLNFYRDGKDSMGWHRDNEASLGRNPTIASISLGETRNFQLRHYEDKKIKLNIPLNSGSLLIMGGESQHFWEHQIPKSKKVSKGRINLTFRKLI